MGTDRTRRRIGIGIVATGAGLALGAALAACGSGSGTTPDEDSVPGPRRYELSATVLDAGTGPQLCAGGVMTSLPPQCSGPTVAGWDWSTAAHEEMGGVRWGGYHLVGTWDGTTFTVTQPPSAPDTGASPDAEELDFSPPCPEPPDGWPVVDGLTIEQHQAFIAEAQAPADFAGLWVDQQTAVADPGRDVHTVAYTGDVDAHRAALESIWPGPLCVVRFPHTLAELQGIQHEIGERAQAGDLGLLLLWSGIDEVRGRVEVGVLVDDPAAVADLEARYGSGVVELLPVATPVE